MHKIWIIARREYLERVRTRSFILLTVLIPALMYGFAYLPILMMNQQRGGSKHLVVVSDDSGMATLIQQQMMRMSDEEREKARAQAPDTPRRRSPQLGSLTVDVDPDISEAHRESLKSQVAQKQLDGVILATREGLAARKISFITPDVAGVIVTSEIEDAINDAVQRNLLKSKGMTEAEIDTALQPISLDAQSPSGTGNPQAVFVTVFAAAILLYMSVLLYGVNVMRAILEEKTSRVMEVMLATAQPRDLMAGKILGVAAVGLTQIAIWAFVVLAPSGVLASLAGGAKGILSARLMIYFAVFFLMGFALYSTVYAAVGAMVNSEQEAQQLQIVVTLPIIIGFLVMTSAIQNPNSSVAVWASMFPLTAPLVMFLRVAITTPPSWQVGLSIALMLATAYGLIWVCSRIYRVGILMYGKRPTLPEIMKWIRYA